MSSNKRQVVKVSELKRISIQFPGDLYVLAAWVAMSDLAYSKQHPNCTRRTTIYGLSKKLSYLTDISSKVIESQLAAAEFPLEATIELDDNSSQNPLFQSITDGRSFDTMLQVGRHQGGLA
jgi:hypothetical protein